MGKAAAVVVAVVAFLAFEIGMLVWVGVDLPVIGRRGPVEGLTGVDWRPVAFEVGGTRQESGAGAGGRVRFDGAGHVGGQVCNFFRMDVVVHGATLEVRDGLSTAMACPDGRGDVERWVHEVLADGATVTWTSSGGVLRLANGDRVLELRRLPA